MRVSREQLKALLWRLPLALFGIVAVVAIAIFWPPNLQSDQLPVGWTPGPEELPAHWVPWAPTVSPPRQGASYIFWTPRGWTGFGPNWDHEGNRTAVTVRVRFDGTTDSRSDPEANTEESVITPASGHLWFLSAQHPGELWRVDSETLQAERALMLTADVLPRPNEGEWGVRFKLARRSEHELYASIVQPLDTGQMAYRVFLIDTDRVQIIETWGERIDAPERFNHGFIGDEFWMWSEQGDRVYRRDLVGDKIVEDTNYYWASPDIDTLPSHLPPARPDRLRSIDSWLATNTYVTGRDAIHTLWVDRQEHPIGFDLQSRSSHGGASLNTLGRRTRAIRDFFLTRPHSPGRSRRVRETRFEGIYATTRGQWENYRLVDGDLNDVLRYAWFHGFGEDGGQGPFGIKLKRWGDDADLILQFMPQTPSALGGSPIVRIGRFQEDATQPEWIAWVRLPDGPLPQEFKLRTGTDAWDMLVEYHSGIYFSRLPVPSAAPDVPPLDMGGWY